MTVCCRLYMNTEVKNKNISRVRIMGGSNKQIGSIVIGLIWCFYFWGRQRWGLNLSIAAVRGEITTCCYDANTPLATTMAPMPSPATIVSEKKVWRTLEMRFWSYSNMYFETNCILLSYQALLDDICFCNMCVCEIDNVQIICIFDSLQKMLKR